MYPPPSLSEIPDAPTPRALGRLESLKGLLSGIFGKDPDSRWGTQLMRISSDMIVICDEDLRICHHNRAFLKAIGHSPGSFRGQNLDVFFPESERRGVIEAFDEWRKGHAAGMRFQASFLTTRGTRIFDARVVRSRDKRGSFFYYMVLREDAKPGRSGRHPEEHEPEPFFQGLPVAAWRTDASLCVTRVYGNLWPQLGAASEDLIGKNMGDPKRSRLPEVFYGIDLTDSLAGMSLQTEVSREGETFSVTVEPFLDEAGQVVGTVGLLRRLPLSRQSGRESFPVFSMVAASHRARHHLPPWTSDGGISIVTGRVPRFSDDADESGEMMETRSFTPRSRGVSSPGVGC